MALGPHNAAVSPESFFAFHGSPAAGLDRFAWCGKLFNVPEALVVRLSRV